jgi:flagellar assembly protein FliH
LSNLVKQWAVRPGETNARVIDSDAIMADILEKSAFRAISAPEVTVDEEAVDPNLTEFREGIAVAEEEEKVQDAKQEAERILEEARAQAQEMIAQAEDSVAEIQEEARKNGYEEGQSQLGQKLEELKTELELSYQDKSSALENEYTARRDDMEKELVDVILEVFNRVFHIQFDNKKHILVYLIDNAISGIEGEKKFRIKVAESNVLFLENHKEDILEHVGHDIELEIIPDFTLEGNACVIETDSGVFDCSLGTQLENLIKDIRSLCS